MQSNPVVVDGVLYATTPTLKVVAVNAATGAEIWKFDPSGGAPPRRAIPPSRRHRAQGSRVRHATATSCTRSTRRPAQPIASFGTDGRIDLREGLGKPAERLSVSASTPGVVFEDLLIIRAARCRKRLPGIAGTHPRVRREHRQAALDLPHHSAARRVRLRHLAEGRLQAVRRRQRVGRRHRRREARHGVRRDRLGVVRFLRRRRGTATTCSPTACSRSTRAPASASGTSRASSTTCGTATFPPRRASSRCTRNGRSVDAVAQITKYGYVYVLDRQTGEPLFPIEYAQGAAVDARRRAGWPSAAVSGEAAAVRAPGPHRGHAHDAHAGGARRGARAVPQDARSGFLAPPSFEGTIIFPGVDGGAEWGGAAFDPDSGAALRQLERDAVDRQADPEQRHLALQQQVRDLPSRGSQGLAAAPSLVRHRRSGMTRDEIATLIRQGTGRMPAFPDMGARNINDVVEFLVTGVDKGKDPKLTSDPELAEVPQRRREHLPRSRRLPGDHAAVGHAERDRSQRRHDPLEDSVRRISGARGEGTEEHRQRQLRRPGRHGQRSAVHRRDELRQEVPRLRQADRQAAVGDDAAGGRQRDAVDLHASTASSTS